MSSLQTENLQRQTPGNQYSLRVTVELTVVAVVLAIALVSYMPATIDGLVAAAPRTVLVLALSVPGVWIAGGMLALLPGTVMMTATVILVRPAMVSLRLYLLGAICCLLLLLVDLVIDPRPFRLGGTYALLLMLFGAALSLFEMWRRRSRRTDAMLCGAALASTGLIYMSIVTVIVMAQG